MNLALNDALDAIEPLKLFYVPHLRMCHSEFKRSSKNRSTLKGIKAELEQFDQTWDWKIFLPALFCLTRWLGLKKCAEIMSRKSNRVLMNKYVAALRARGMGPRHFDPYKYRRRRRQRDAEEAGADNVDGDEDDVDTDEEEELVQVRAAIESGRLDADGYQPQPRLFSSAEAAAASAPSQTECVRVDNFDEGRVGATGKKCKNLLNKDVGLTDLNCGRSAYLSGLLKPYQVLHAYTHVHACTHSTCTHAHTQHILTHTHTITGVA